MLLFQPSHEHFEVKVVAFRAAIAIINTLSPSDGNLLLRLADCPDMNAAVPKERRIQPLLFDLLRFRLVGARLQTAKNVNHCCRSFCIHKRLAREALSLEMFPVDLDNLGRPKVSAWKLGNIILTLRLGSEQYFGWVELVVRTPCSRIRRLVRWKKELIIQQPGSTLPFWELLHPRQRSVNGEFRVTVQNVRSNLESEATAENLGWAASVIASFDRLVDFSPADIPSRHEVDGIKAHATIMPDLPIAFLHRNHQYRKPNYIAADTGNSRLKRTFSDGSLASLRPSQRDALRNKNGTVISWLQNATSRDDVDAELIHELEMFGFSPLALGAPSTVIGPTAYSDLSVHDKLVPFTVGSNFNRAISILDRITPFQTHRVGLLYGGPFSNATCGSNNSNSDGDQFLAATQAPTDFWDFAR